jgi:DUF971 family protein
MSGNPYEICVADLRDAEEALDITWGDGHQSVYSLKELRKECPCAGCRSAREEAKRNTDPFRVLASNVRPPSHTVTNIEAVGRYGMRIGWGDGHNTGIYTFEYLRELCPCEVCRAARRADDLPYVHGIYIPQ